MPATIKPVDKLLEQATDVNIPVYLDVTSLVQFGIWGRDHVAELVSRIKTDGLQIVVFDAQLKNAYRRAKYQTAEKQLETFEVVLDEEAWVDDDDVFSAELESIYFHDEDAPLCDLHARFLVLARHASTTHALRIITAYPSFSRLVNAEIFMLPDVAADVDLPANLDLFTDLGIHPQLRSVVMNAMLNKDYVGLVQDAVQELMEHLRNTDPVAFATPPNHFDGWDLATRALAYQNMLFKVDKTYNQTLPATPHIKLSTLSTLSDKDEHKGYYHLVGGAYSAFRNISAHSGPSSAARNQRFGDKRTAIKILCFLSLLFEKIDNHVP